MSEKYDSILGHSRPVSQNHPPMSLYARAVQFAPFAALTGHSDAIDETARRTEEKIEPADGLQEEIDLALRDIAEAIRERPTVTLTYFIPDAKKAGGRYETSTVRVLQIDRLTQTLTLTDGREIPFDCILSLVR